MERITGPYKGFFIAAYTVENDAGHVGYAKVCLIEPDSVWNADPVEKFTSATGFRTELEAIVAAERKARKDIAEMVGVDHIPTGPAPLTAIPEPSGFDWHLHRSRRR
ncbi:MAG TPA: hypothetical protein VKP68_00530 [Ramlibacter sp.]|nr:hypothetical protein [Ramlibacter sp.]